MSYNDVTSPLPGILRNGWKRCASWHSTQNSQCHFFAAYKRIHCNAPFWTFNLPAIFSPQKLDSEFTTLNLEEHD
jgi:hypothetical protein